MSTRVSIHDWNGRSQARDASTLHYRARNVLILPVFDSVLGRQHSPAIRSSSYTSSDIPRSTSSQYDVPYIEAYAVGLLSSQSVIATLAQKTHCNTKLVFSLPPDTQGWMSPSNSLIG